MLHYCGQSDQNLPGTQIVTTSCKSVIKETNKEKGGALYTCMSHISIQTSHSSRRLVAANGTAQSEETELALDDTCRR